jgi:hypothetical protein
MTPGTLAPWAALAALGAFHGVNPAMGWLFAVALGLQNGRRSAVLGALSPIAIGHAASIALVVATVAAASAVVPMRALRIAGGLAVLGAGLYKMARGSGHPRWVGMRVGFRDLTLWSFLMSSAHGAGLMLVPILLASDDGATTAGSAHAAHAAHAARVATLAAGGSSSSRLLAAATVLAVHSGAMLLVMGIVAVAVYETFGVSFLRRAWINLDVLWAAALVAAGALTLLMAW